MKPQGRQHYKCNTGAKHSVKNSKKFPSWWEDVCEPSQKRERQQNKKEIREWADV